MKFTRYLSVVLGSICLISAAAAAAASNEIRIARQYGIGYLQFMIMEHEHLVERRAAAAGLKNVTTTWSLLGGGSSVNDALLSGNIDVAAMGTPPLVVLWAKTSGERAVRGVAAMNSYPMYLNTRNPEIHAMKDFTAKDRIAVPAVGVSSQAIALQMAAEKEFGEAGIHKFDPLTVAMKHPDAVIAMKTGSAGIDSHFTNEPFSSHELDSPGIHTVVDSFQIFGGPATAVVAVASARFRSEQPKLYEAFFHALGDATTFINENRARAAQIYIEMSGDKSIPADKLTAIISDPQFTYTLTPSNIMQTATFMAKVGLVKQKAASWKDLFFEEAHGLPGS